MMVSVRNEAIGIVAERGVNSKTVFAHLVGKNVSSKLSVYAFDDLLKQWLEQNSPKLRDWYLRNADQHDKVLIEAFFSQPQVLDTPIASDINKPPQSTRIETTIIEFYVTPLFRGKLSWHNNLSARYVLKLFSCVMVVFMLKLTM